MIRWSQASRIALLAPAFVACTPLEYAEPQFSSASPAARPVAGRMVPETESATGKDSPRDKKNEPPPWLTKALARESAKLKSVTSRSPDGRLSVMTLTSGEIEWHPADHGEFKLSVPLGREVSSMECTIALDDPRPAAHLASLVSVVTESFPTHEFVRHEIGAVGRVPYVSNELQYLTDGDGGKKALGGLKTMTFLRGRHTILCLHDVLGYRETFTKAADAIARSLTVRDEAESATLERTITVSYVGTIPVGFSMSTRSALADGEVLDEEFGVSAVPRSSTSLSLSDSSEHTRSGADGIVRAITIVDDDGDDATHLDVTRGKGNAYTVAGTFDGKTLSGTFTAEPALFTYEHAQKARDPLAKELRYGVYSPKHNPLGITFRKQRRRERGIVETETDGVRTVATPLVGTAKPRMRIKTGNNVVDIEQVYHWEPKTK